MIVNKKKAPVWAVILVLVLVTVCMLTLVTAAPRPVEEEEGLPSIYGRVTQLSGSDSMEVETLHVQMDGDRITDFGVESTYWLRLGSDLTVTDSDGNPLPRSSLCSTADVLPNFVTVWFDPDSLGKDSPSFLLKASAVRVESVHSD